MISTQFNSLPLLSVKSGLDGSLAEISRALEQYFSTGGVSKSSLQMALAEMHRTRGVLQMLSMNGAVVFSGELEKLLQEMLQQEAPVTTERRDIIRRALFGLTHFLDAVADGASNATLRLFSEYQDVLQARGIEMAFEADLFFPELEVELPGEVLQPAQEDDATSRIKSARMQYQQALLKWLRGDQQEPLRAMRAAVQSAMLCVPQNGQRAFWWVSAGLLDCLMHDGLSPELNAKKQLGRIDLHMKSMIDNTVIDNDATIYEMLYLLARSHAVTATVEAIKQTYQLDSYLPADNPLPPNEIAAVLRQMHEHLVAANETWERCVTEDAESCVRFNKLIEQLQVLAEQLDRNTLQFLCKQIQAAAAQTDDPERAPRIAVDMAMALLLLESGIEHYQHLGSAFHEQARLLGARLQAGLMRMPEDPGKFANLVALYCEMEQRGVLAPLAKEMQDNLQHVEQSLTAFFGNASKRSELSVINRLLSQVQGGLHILSLDVGVQLLAMLRQVTDSYVKGETPSAQEMRAVAETVSALEGYVSDLTTGQRPNTAALQSVLDGIAAVREESGQPAEESPQELAPVGVPVRAGNEDEELLEVFLEEAREVMETLRDNLEVSRAHLDSREPLVIMRRAFHTLKGSGRMVGLSELGEVAWAVERAMNKWLQDNKPAKPVLLDMIGDAEVLFQHWIDVLHSGKADATIDASQLTMAANRLEEGNEEPVQVRPSRAEEVPPGPVAVIEVPEQVVIGNVSLSATLFAIATEEAANHVRSLQRLWAELRDAEPPLAISYEFMRAAHTLAGVNRTMGFVQVAELAYALEQWSGERMDKPGQIDRIQLDRLGRVVTRLDELCATVRARQEPPAQAELIAELQADKLEEIDADLMLLTHPSALELPFEPPTVVEVEPAAALEQPFAFELELPAAATEQIVAEQPLAAEIPALAIAEPPAAETVVVVAEHAGVDADAPEHTTPADTRSVVDEVDEQLLPIFLEEAHELYPQIGSGLRAWREEPGNRQHSHTLQRVLHTLKGSARMAGAMRLGELTHRVEGRIESAVSKGQVNDALWEEMDNYLDRIGIAIEQLQGAEPAAEDAAETIAPATPEQAAQSEPATEVAGSVAPVAKTAQPKLEVGAERAMVGALLRVRSDTVDELVNEAGEISVARSRIELELREFKNGVQELTDSVNRLRQQLREIEIQAEGQMQARTSTSSDSADKFDPLEFDRFTRFQELTRFMNESVHDVQTVQQALLKNLAETDAALAAQAHLNRDMQQNLMVIRMVPFSSVSERLYRIVRQTAKELGKRANLELLGVDVELDRSVLEKMAAPFEHLLRNAIAHGLEDPAHRQQAGKDGIGEIKLALRQESNEVVFEFSDDGAGIDLARLRQKAVQQGLLNDGETISDEQAMQLIFASGLSTAREITEISGRGVGLDVVRSEISALGGRVDVSSVSGQGTRFTIHLPLTLAVTKALLVSVDQDIYALPSTMVEQVQQLKPASLEAAYQQHQIEWQGNRYPLHHLSRILGNDEVEVVSRPHNPVLLLRSGDKRIALHVDELLGNQEIVVKNIGPQLARLPGVLGATVSPNGDVILIIDPIAYSQRIQSGFREKKAAVETEPVRTLPLVMIVDDSLTVRKITTRLLTRAGYMAVTAKDGVDALEQLTDLTPAVILLDVEMPRMDGFELAKRLRQDAKTRDVPIIMITSRTADKHRNYALELGVNEYLGKPYQEDELLEHIARYTSMPETA